MEAIFSAISDMIVIFFDLLIYNKLTSFRRDTKPVRILVYALCFAILISYFVATYYFKVPAAISSFLIMSLPSFLLFFVISKYKDARFFVTFCFVDTVTLIIAFFSRVLGIYGGTVGMGIGCVLVLGLFLIIYIVGKQYFMRYRELLDTISHGWVPMMVSTLLIYTVLVVVPAYPMPMVERLEYIPVYFLISFTVISFYIVFISLLLQRKSLKELNDQLTNEKKWHRIAYVDALTDLSNRMAYIERINRVSREADPESEIHAVMLDIDGFKSVNDTFGHHVGDEILKKVADVLRKIFGDEGYEVFRVGGDEFAVVAVGVTADELAEKLGSIDSFKDEMSCSISYGCAKVHHQDENDIENAFIRADARMYRHKKSKQEQ